VTNSWLFSAFTCATPGGGGGEGRDAALPQRYLLPRAAANATCLLPHTCASSRTYDIIICLCPTLPANALLWRYIY